MKPRRTAPAMTVAMAAMLAAVVALPAARPATAASRAQIDSVGFACTWADMATIAAACHAREGDAVAARRAELGLTKDMPWLAAIMPHDDYLYAGRTALHLLPGLQAERWVVLGVCHACRRQNVRDRLLFDSWETWSVAGRDLPVDIELRDELRRRLGQDLAAIDDARHAAEHSVEALLPWLHLARADMRFVAVLVPTMDHDRLHEAAAVLGAVLADLCRENDWEPGRDLGLLISADAVHYGCEGWGEGGGYHPFGCDASGHAAAVAQDRTLAEATLAGPLTASGPDAFLRLVWNPARLEYPYRITWCGVYSIPCGLLTAAAWQRAMGRPPLVGHLLRYGDSATDGRLPLPGGAATHPKLGVTAPNSLQHWVGYPALGYVASRVKP